MNSYYSCFLESALNKMGFYFVLEENMITMYKLLQSITDEMDEGLICINNEKNILLCNQKAKEIIGLVIDKINSHPSAQVEVGDIVIIADNSLGNDDGELLPEELGLININDSNIKNGFIIIGVGVYKNPEINAVYKYMRNPLLAKELILETNYLGFTISISIDTVDKIISIKVNDTVQNMSYLEAIGHMVILDGKTGQIKFFQARGYTIRKESIGDILRGQPFLGKGGDLKARNVIGSKIDDIFEYNELIKKINAVITGEEAYAIDSLYEINKRLTLCSIWPVMDQDSIMGVLLKIKDASELGRLLDDRNQIIEKVENAYLKFALTNSTIPENCFTDFVGSSYVMQKTKYLAYKASKMKFNVIITGESGTGKSKLAFEIHNLYKKGSPFVTVNCSSIPSNLFESELFGYVGGAFTGALPGGKSGYFEMANGGTIFLDEIGEIPVEIQVKLLQVLQTKRFYKVGSSKPIDIDVRIIAATNKDLALAVENKSFRQDLYYRINVFPIEIPPLRERKTDIYLLINHIMKNISDQYNSPIKQLSGKALTEMLNYSWPGNVRELENVLERAVALCDSNIIFKEYISIVSENIHGTLKGIMQETEKKILTEAIRQFSGDRNQAIRSLGISKSAFYEKLCKYRI